jgi:cellulose biosynthesis protein BcsQ
MPNAVLVANGKGGVGKTSIAANVAGMAARAGKRVLVVDLDPQGNLGSDLGYRQRGAGDDGLSLLRAVEARTDPTVMQQVRPGLDVVAGGRAVRGLADRLTVEIHRDPAAVTGLGHALAPVSSRYDLVLLDAPPSTGSLIDAALASVRWVLSPVRADDASLDGLEVMARAFPPARSHNPKLQLMGVVMFDLAIGATALRSELRSLLEDELGGVAPVFCSVIRRSERSAFDMRRFGLLAIEYLERARSELSAPSVEGRISTQRLDGAVARFSSAAAGLAQDYRDLTGEILALIEEHRP